MGFFNWKVGWILIIPSSEIQFFCFIERLCKCEIFQTLKLTEHLLQDYSGVQSGPQVNLLLDHTDF